MQEQTHRFYETVADNTGDALAADYQEIVTLPKPLGRQEQQIHKKITQPKHEGIADNLGMEIRPKAEDLAKEEPISKPREIRLRNEGEAIRPAVAIVDRPESAPIHSGFSLQELSVAQPESHEILEEPQAFVEQGQFVLEDKVREIVSIEGLSGDIVADALVRDNVLSESRDVLSGEHEVGDELHFEEVDELPSVLVELFTEAKASDESITAVELSEIAAEVGTSEPETPDATNFAERLVEYVQSLPEKPELVYEAQPATLMEDIIEKAVKIQELQAGEDVAPEIIVEAKEELELLCKELLENLGIEADEKVVALLVEKILASEKLSEIVRKKLSIEELARQGTHEYKLENWFNKFQKFKQLLNTSAHPHRTVGRLALDLVSTAS